MKAIRYQEAGGPEVIQLIDAPIPVVRPHDLLVRVHAAGLNRADILQRQGFYGEQPDFGDSTVPGLEIAGNIVAMGTEAEGFQTDERVMGIVGGGAHAEYARIDSRMAMRVPENLNWVQAAAISEVFVTAHEALLHLGELPENGWALIHAAAGGVGSAAIMLAHAIGAHSIFTASGAERLEAIQSIGGSIGVDYRRQDFAEVVQHATEGRGVDVVVDFIGAPYLGRNLSSLAEGGRLIQVGTLGGSEGTLSLDLLLHRHLRIFGTVMKSRCFEEKLAMVQRFRDRWLDSFASGGLKPVIAQSYPLTEAGKAHAAMEAAGNFGRILLTME